MSQLEASQGKSREEEKLSKVGIAVFFQAMTGGLAVYSIAKSCEHLFGCLSLQILDVSNQPEFLQVGVLHHQKVFTLPSVHNSTAMSDSTTRRTRASNANAHPGHVVLNATWKRRTKAEIAADNKRIQEQLEVKEAAALEGI